MEDVQVPPYFLCPISLEIMKDPVTISTGITYDRQSIERWMLSTKKTTTCPVTQQPLPHDDLVIIPNVTLGRLIRSWCAINAPRGVERVPTPKPPASASQISRLLREASSTREMQAKCVQDLRRMASQCETNKRLMESAGGPEFLAAVVKSNARDGTSSDDPACHALCLLKELRLSEAGLKSILGRDTQFVDALIRAMQRGSYESRANAVKLLESMLEFADPLQITSLNLSFFRELVLVLREDSSSKSALRVLASVCRKGRNRIKAAEAGAVAALIDLLLDSTEKRSCESALVVLDQLCQCPEGRAELLKHAAGLAVVSKKILRVSEAATERGVRILHSVSRFSASRSVAQEMLQMGVGAKLCMVIQVECGSKTRERAAEILKLHAKDWKNSHQCIPLLSLIYPTHGS
ncbi:unnamed protein product [Cuscuta campestris]|uniref:U-box domain-containing protein n=1 Tax=Cuscuta campestris TaxID=132261 RepID=A0A484LA18_9ASTE|nr:unnamed protein product [Cuscuta campestris]